MIVHELIVISINQSQWSQSLHLQFSMLTFKLIYKWTPCKITDNHTSQSVTRTRNIYPRQLKYLNCNRNSLAQTRQTGSTREKKVPHPERKNAPKSAGSGGNASDWREIWGEKGRKRETRDRQDEGISSCHLSLFLPLPSIYCRALACDVRTCRASRARARPT